MPLFVKDGVSVLYIHVPKTGGSSIEQMFIDHGFRAEFLDDGSRPGFNDYRRCTPQHMHAELLSALLRPVTIDFTFMTVRHPVSRLLSDYRMHVREKGQPRQLGRWLDKMMTFYMDSPYARDNHLRPQHEFLMPGCDVFRQEDGFGARFIERLSARTGMVFAENAVPFHNQDHGVAIDDAEIERVRPTILQFYRQDFTTFGYQKLP